MPHTSASVFCRTFHIEAASVDIHLLSVVSAHDQCTIAIHFLS